ncbi:MAG: hypothetical protein WD716_06135 [Fimbriimonadaceae bacterium]
MEGRFVVKGLVTAVFVFGGVACGWAQNPRMGNDGHNNAVLTVAISGFLTNGEYRTGSNSSFSIEIASSLGTEPPITWNRCYLTDITLTIGGQSVALDLEDIGEVEVSSSYQRIIRWSTVHFPSYVSGSETNEITITLTATANAELRGPPPLGGGDPPLLDGPEELEATVSILVRPYNVALLNATEVDGQGDPDSSPDGAPAVAAIGVDDARDQLGSQNHFVLAGDHHDHLKIAQFLDGSGNPVTGNDPQLLLSTVFFTYTHGFSTHI